MQGEQWIKSELNKLRASALDRHIITYKNINGKLCKKNKTFLNFSSNNYLDLAINSNLADGAIKALRTFGSSSTASRLMTGTISLHNKLERRLSKINGYPQAILFGSGYLANVGVIPAIVGRDDYIYADKFIHASIVDGIIISRAHFRRFNHNDTKHLKKIIEKDPEEKRRLIITESVFSMDGDIAPLVKIADIAKSYNALLMVDESHAMGVFGPAGSGLVHKLGLESDVNISMGTLSKALGCYGGFITCTNAMHKLLINRARSFIYSTALPPAIIGSALSSLNILEKKSDIGSILLNNALFFRQLLNKAGIDTVNSKSQIIPIIVGTTTKTLELSRRLKKEGILAVPIRPPTVPEGSARLRLSVTLEHTREDLKNAAEIIIKCAVKEKIL